MFLHPSSRAAATAGIVLSMVFFIAATSSVGAPPTWSVKPESSTIARFNVIPHKLFNALPDAYDLRDVGRAAPAYPEQDCASCWASAATYMMESLLLPWEDADLSQTHMQLTQGGSCQSGNSVAGAINYLAAWNGPVTESDYQQAILVDPGVEIHEQLHLMQARYLPVRQDPLDNDAIKHAIYHHGPLYAGVSWRGMTNQANQSYYWPENSPSHPVALIGWDEHYQKEASTHEFNGTSYTPEGDGAFIAKNNDGHFFYLSYYDGTVGYNDVAWFGVEPVDNHQVICQYDLHGTQGWICPHMIPDNQYLSAIYGANLFTARADGTLTSIGFLVQPYMIPDGEQAIFEVAIHLDPDMGPVRTAGPDLSFTTMMSSGVYFGINLPTQMPLTAGQQFSVVVRGYRSTGSVDAVCLPAAKAPYDPVSISPDESFVSRDGWIWFDMTDVPSIDSQSGTMDYVFGNLGIKAYTQPPADNPA